MRRWILIAVLVLVVAPALGLSAWIFGALKFSYSDGQRTGYVQKISHKGWLCKTWEGELAMATQAGIPPQIFVFSVRDDSVAEQILKGGGQLGKVLPRRFIDENRALHPSECSRPGETFHHVSGFHYLFRFDSRFVSRIVN